MFAHDAAFPLELPFGFSRLRYAEPWYFGVCRGMALLQMFRPEDRVWLSQSPSGGGTGCPAWDFQWFIPEPRLGERYQLRMRAAYLPLERPDDLGSVRERVLQTVARSQPPQGASAVQDGSVGEASTEPALPTQPGPSPRAVAFYYPWYGNPATDGRYANWNHAVAVRNEPPRSCPGDDDVGANFYPALGCYSSNDPATRREHMRQLRRAGVGVICASWWGRNTFTDCALPGLFKAAEEARFAVNVHLDPFPARNALTTREAITCLIGKFGGSPAFHRLPGRGHRPVFSLPADHYLDRTAYWVGRLTRP